MNAKEMNDIWRLIGTYRKGDKRLSDDSLLKAWYAAMRIYDANDVRNAVIEHFRTSSFFPDVSEITSKLPRTVVRERENLPNQGFTPVPDNWHEEWYKRLAEKGLPTLADALEQGMTLTQWKNKLDEANAW